jgi:hypothetical protein
MKKKIIGIVSLCLLFIAGMVNAATINDTIEIQNGQPSLGIIRDVKIGGLNNVEILYSGISPGKVTSPDNGDHVFYEGRLPIFLDVTIRGTVAADTIIEFLLPNLLSRDSNKQLPGIFYKKDRDDLKINNGDTVEIYFAVCLKTYGYIIKDDIWGWFGTVISPSIRVV